MIVRPRPPSPLYPAFSPGGDVRGLGRYGGTAEELGTGVGAGVTFEGAPIWRGVATGVLVFVITRLIDRAFFKGS